MPKEVTLQNKHFQRFSLKSQGYAIDLRFILNLICSRIPGIDCMHRYFVVYLVSHRAHAARLGNTQPAIIRIGLFIYFRKYFLLRTVFRGAARSADDVVFGELTFPIDDGEWRRRCDIKQPKGKIRGFPVGTDVSSLSGGVLI